MGRKPKYIETLTAEEKSSLQKGFKQGKSPLYRRKCHSILLSNSQKTTDEIAKIFNVTTYSVCSWLRQWEKSGIEGLKLKPGRGRKPKLDINQDTHVQTIKTLIQNEPKNLRKVTAQIKTDLEIEVSKKTLKRFLKNLNTNGNVSVGA